MAESNVEPELEWSDRALDAAEDTLIAIETLLATLRAFEDVLRQQELSIASSTEYCDNFCQALMHYAGSRNSMEHGLPLLEVYCLSITCFAAARSHLTAESDRVALVLKRLALSCFELMLSVPENEIPYEAWVQFHHSVQISHETLLRYGSTDLQALLQITGEGGAWSNPVLTSLLTGQPTSQEEVDAYISLEGEGFMEMRVKHLEKMGEVAKAVVLAKACTECSLISNHATFRQTYVCLLCHLLPNEEAIMEISRLDCKDVLEITCNMETEGEENTAFILCTTFLTQQLQQQSIYSTWELILLWSKLQRRIDPSLASLLERCLQLGAIAKTVHHLLYLVRVIQTEAEEIGVPSSVELCVKALQLPMQDDSETRISVCKTVSCLLPGDLEVLRACLLTEFLLGPNQEAFGCLEELYRRPDQKYDLENEVIPNSLRCELLLALKAYWPFDPEFWDWKTLKCHCSSLLGLVPESEGEVEEDEVVDKQEMSKQCETQGITIKVESENEKRINGNFGGHEQQEKPESNGKSERKRVFCCQICKNAVADGQIVHHSKRHAENDCHPCPVCSEKFKSRKELIPHIKKHISSETHLYKNNIKKEDLQKLMDEEDDIEPGEITVDPSLMLYYKSTHDPDVLQHIVQQTKAVKDKQVDDDEHITFEYIEQHFRLQNRDEYLCPGTGCTRIFKHSKYLYVHLKSEHRGDENVKHFHQMRDKREKCVFCRRHFVSAYHHRKHRRIHYGDQPYSCVVSGCGAQFRTSHQLVTHKHTHGYQLNYQCELKGCYATYSDLGQLYHHEAQHFRDAAFTCFSAECRKYYLSKKEFIKHLSTHNITFSEEDFEAQRKAKQKLLQTVTDVKPPNTKSFQTEAIVNDVPNSSSVSCASSLKASDTKEPKATMTLVAVCFDGSKFTCGFEKCGMTFSRARDVQRHLKCAHPEHLKLENKEYKHDKEQDPKSKRLNTKTEPDNEEKGKNELAASFQAIKSSKEGKSSTQPKGNETNPSSNQAKGDGLKEILIGLSKLDLNSSLPQSVPSESPQSDQESNASQVSLHQAIMARPPFVLLQQRSPHLLEERVQTTSEETAADDKAGIESLAKAKPYICEMKDCGFRTAQSYNLQRHYNNIHGRTVEQAKRLTSLKATFKPYTCHICSKPHREKHLLRAHYIQAHNLSETSVNKITIASTRCKGGQDTSNHTSQPLTDHSLTARKKEAPTLQHEEKNSAGGTDNHSPPEEEGREEAESREEGSEQKAQSEDGATQQVRTTRRLVARSNLCYILDKFSKPFHCVVKNCDAAFSTQGGLVRHLQLVHRYNRSQLLLEKDFDSHHGPESRKEHAKKRPPNFDEPQPQYKCHFANCNASYHLKSSLVRHTRDTHTLPSELVRCKHEGCTKMFSHHDSLRKHMLQSHCEFYDSLVVHLQSTQKTSVTGCQKKLIVAAQSPLKEEAGPTTTQVERPDAESEGAVQSNKKGKKAVVRKKVREPTKRNPFSIFVFRSHEEALQMCQDRGLPLAFPCMFQGCDSVVMYIGSLHRHYLQVHRMRREDLDKNDDKLVFTAEQLEELIQRKSARATAAGACTPNGVRVMEYQSEAEPNTGGQSAPVSLHSLKTCQSEAEPNTGGQSAPVSLHSLKTCQSEAEPNTGGQSAPVSLHSLKTCQSEAEPKSGGQSAPISLHSLKTCQSEAEPKSGGQSAPISLHSLKTCPSDAEPKSGGLSAPISLHAPKTDSQDEDNDPLAFPKEEQKEPPPVERNGVLVGADEVLYGEPSTDGHTDDSATAPKSQKPERLSLDQIRPLLRPVTVDLSPPCSLRFTTDEGNQDVLIMKDGSKILNGSVLSTPMRQPLKRKNELSEQPANLKDSQPRSTSPQHFDIASYKPIGFESSFLRFIQETTPKDKNAAQTKRRETFRRSCSVKENNQLGISRTRSRRTHSPLLKPHAMTGDFKSVQNLKSILDKALAGCGDLAIKQLQYLRPVVVLGRPVCTATPSDRFPSEANGKLLLGS